MFRSNFGASINSPCYLYANAHCFLSLKAQLRASKKTTPRSTLARSTRIWSCFGTPRSHFSQRYHHTSIRTSQDHSPDSKMAPKVLMFGTGAVGSTYAYLLSRQVPTSNIVTVCRSNYNAVKSNGITINSTLWGMNLTFKPTVVQSISEATSVSDQPFDYILVTAKALQTSPSIAEQIQPAVSEKTSIVLIQNGIGIEEPYSTIYPSNPLISGVVYLPVTQSSPGIVSHREIELLHLGTYPSSAPPPHKHAVEQFASLLNSCNASTKLHDDIQFERWSKLLVNASWNPICALTRSRDAEFMKSTGLPEDETAAYVQDVMREIASVARACGYEKINDELIDFQIGRAKARDVPGIEPSMLADAHGGRRMEVDAIVGNTVRIAREKGLQTPLLRGLYLLLSGLDGSFARAAEDEKGA